MGTFDDAFAGFVYDDGGGEGGEGDGPAGQVGGLWCGEVCVPGFEFFDEVLLYGGGVEVFL